MRRRVLIVEDDTFSRHMLVGTVAALGFEPLPANDLAHARQLFAERRVDAAVLDLDLGESVTGVDLANELLVEKPGLPIVILTALPAPELAGKSRRDVTNRMTFLVKSDLQGPTDLRAALSGRPGESSEAGIDGPRSTEGRVAIRRSQAELLRRIAAGQSNADIARERGVSLRAVEVQVGRLFRSLGLHRSEGAPRVLAARWFREGRVTVK